MRGLLSFGLHDLLEVLDALLEVIDPHVEVGVSLHSRRQRRQQIVYLGQLLVGVSHRQSPPMRPYAGACRRACQNPCQPVDTARDTLARHTSRRNHRTSIPCVRCVAPIVGICASCRTRDTRGSHLTRMASAGALIVRNR